MEILCGCIALQIEMTPGSDSGAIQGTYASERLPDVSINSAWEPRVDW